MTNVTAGESDIREKKLLPQKLLFTLIIVVIYLLGRTIPVLGVDTAVHSAADSQNLLLQTIGGDAYRTSVFALGISPYMLASLFAMFYTVVKSRDKSSKVSPVFVGRLTISITFIISVLQAIQRTDEFYFSGTGMELEFYTHTARIELVAGTMIIMWLAERNKKFGIGGQTALIFVNIVDGIIRSFMKYDMEKLLYPMLVSLAVIAISAYMESTEKRIPLQRISIHNIHADKNYLAIKHNPVGVMPIMFSSAVYMLPVAVIKALASSNPANPTFRRMVEDLELSRMPGIILYLSAFFILTITFAFVMINPKEVSEQFLKSGDGIVGVRAGKETTRFLKKELLKCSLLSALVMGICIAVSLGLQLFINIDSALAMLPCSFMMLTGISCNLWQETRAVKDYDSYHKFL